MSEEALYAGLVRRRRVLVVLSLALAGANNLHFTITEVDILGNHATVGRSEDVEGVAIVVWAVALVVYMRWFRDCAVSAAALIASMQ